jgi:hypothetical protein
MGRVKLGMFAFLEMTMGSNYQGNKGDFKYIKTSELNVIVEPIVKLRWIKLYKIHGILHVKVLYKKVLLVACLVAKEWLERLFLKIMSHMRSYVFGSSRNIVVRYYELLVLFPNT